VFFNNPNLDAAVEPIRASAEVGPAPLFGDWLRDKSYRQRAVT
jgi:hypothetical protein